MIYKNYWVNQRRAKLFRQFVHEELSKRHTLKYLKRTSTGAAYWDSALLDAVVADLLASHPDLDSVNLEDIDVSVIFHSDKS